MSYEDLLFNAIFSIDSYFIFTPTRFSNLTGTTTNIGFYHQKSLRFFLVQSFWTSINQVQQCNVSKFQIIHSYLEIPNPTQKIINNRPALLRLLSSTWEIHTQEVANCFVCYAKMQRAMLCYAAHTIVHCCVSVLLFKRSVGYQKSMFLFYILYILVLDWRRYWFYTTM